MAIEVNIDKQLLRQAIQEEYKEVATTPTKGFHFHVGRVLADKLDYPADQVDSLPENVVESFAGVANPFECGDLTPGETVLDVGAGAGFDAILAARQVGENGKVIGVDMTPVMIEKAQRNAESAGLENIEFRQGYIEELPVEDNSIDVVISNGVINLTPDKDQAYNEIYRVLKPGGRFQIADIAVQKIVPQSAKDDIDLWTG